MQLTEHFSLEEMVYSETAHRFAVKNDPMAAQLANLKIVAENMEEVRKVLGNRPIFVTSAYRCERINNLVGGSATSSHVQGLACDFKVAGISNYEAAKLIEASNMKFDQLILEYGWVHIGFGVRMRRQVLTKKSASSPYEKGLVV
jgi:zinc D-Ala-D-Ala carboxypeptidase